MSGNEDRYAIRPGEQSSGTEVKNDAIVQFIGTIRTPFTTRDLCPRQGDPDGPECRLEVLPDWDPQYRVLFSQ